MGLLGAEIANEVSPAHVRQSAALALKNQLTAKEQPRREEYQAKWVALDPEIKTSIKKNVSLTGSDLVDGRRCRRLRRGIIGRRLRRRPSLLPLPRLKFLGVSGLI
jgi:Importin-beta N-terminal domain